MDHNRIPNKSAPRVLNNQQLPPRHTAHPARPCRYSANTPYRCQFPDEHTGICTKKTTRCTPDCRAGLFPGICVLSKPASLKKPRRKTPPRKPRNGTDSRKKPSLRTSTRTRTRFRTRRENLSHCKNFFPTREANKKTSHNTRKSAGKKPTPHRELAHKQKS